MIHRRTFLQGMFSALAAPAIVRAASLMPVKALVPQAELVLPAAFERELSALQNELAAITRRAFVPRLYVDLYRADPILAQLVEQT